MANRRLQALAAEPPKGWNQRLQGLHGVGCPGGWYIQGSVMGENILDPTLLGRGFGMFINILAGMTKKSGGRVAIWGRDIDERPRDHRP